MKKTVLSILLVFIITISPLSPYQKNLLAEDVITTLSLEEAINKGIENSTQLTISELEIEVKKVELSEARHQEKKYQKTGVSIGTVDGFALDANMLSKKAEYALEEEKLKQEYLKENIKLNVMSAYYGALQAEEYLHVTNSTLDNLQRNHDIIKKKFNLGMVSKSDLYMSEIALNEGEINVEKAKENVKKAFRALNMTLNSPLDTKLKLTSDFAQNDFQTNLNEDVEVAYTKRFDIIQLNNNYQLVKLDFETNAIVYTPNTFIYKYKERNVAKMENLLHNAKLNIEFDIKGKYDEIESAKKQIALAKANVEKAKEGLRLRELSYHAGTGTILEVKEAITQLHNAQLAVSNAITSYNLKILEYHKAVNLGTIS